LQRLTLTAQLRHDWVEGDSPTTWRIGAVYDLKPIATHFHVAYGTGFRAASLFERYGVDSYGYTGNPNLKAEQSEGWEAGFITDIPAAGRSDFASIGATYFDQRVRNLIVGIYTPVDTDINLDSAHVHGIEAQATVHPLAWLDLGATYTLLDTTSVGQPASEGSQLLRRPQNQASGDVTIRPLKRLRITATLLYTGSAHDYLYDNSGNGIGYGVGQHGLIANLTGTYTVTPNADIYLNGFNILDSRYEPVNGFQTPGPTVLAGVRFRL
jgi:vitamin B12 transporter